MPLGSCLPVCIPPILVLASYFAGPSACSHLEGKECKEKFCHDCSGTWRRVVAGSTSRVFWATSTRTRAGRDRGSVFPARRQYIERIGGQRQRQHLHESAVQRAVAAAALGSGINKRATFHTFRHSFATRLLEAAPKFGRCRSCWGTGTYRRR